MKLRCAQTTGRAALAAALLALCASCAAPRIPDAGERGLAGDARDAAASASSERGNRDIPPPVTGAPRLPPPSPPETTERYDVVVDRVPVSELLFALARDAEIEIDIIGDIEGRVTLNATDATLPRLLERIALQAPIRYELREDYLRIAADVPYLVNYPVDYVDITRTASSAVDTATQISSTGFGEGGGGGGGGGAGSNNSSTTLANESDNQFWTTLEANLAGLLALGGDAADNRIMVNPEAGYVSLRATERQHREVQEYLDRVVASARRQVMIEATVVEVTLSDRHQAGVDWAQLSQNDGVEFVQNMTGSALGGAFNVPDPASGAQPAATIGYTDTSGDDSLQGTIKLLNEFGEVRVVSSPKITALNNQIAILKVVDNHVYFTVDVESNVADGIVQTTYDTEVNTVPVGLVMTVTPYIGAGDEVLLNVRPTVSRILGFKEDPNPELQTAGAVNEIPEIQVREMESMLRVQSAQTAVIGGLMQNSADRTHRSVPFLGDLPLIGGLFSYRDDELSKTELIIFLRPTVVDEASIAGDYHRFRSYMPDPHGADLGRGGWQ